MVPQRPHNTASTIPKKQHLMGTLAYTNESGSHRQNTQTLAKSSFWSIDLVYNSYYY